MTEEFPLKLFMILLGSKASARNVEQHDYFFSVAANLKELIPEMKLFWPEAGDSIHIDGWRLITKVEDYAIEVVKKQEAIMSSSSKKLFFLNLGGYQHNKLEEQHYTFLTVQEDRNQAIMKAKKTYFFKMNALKGFANSHIDEKYGIDVDDIYRIEDLLSATQKDKYAINIFTAENLPEDEINLGYLRLNKIV